MSKPVEITLSGPVVVGEADGVMAKFMAEFADEMSLLAVNEVQQRLRRVLREPTGRYERSVVSDRQANDLVIRGDRVIYGAWLEGVADRNKASRFKGYATFRKVREDLDRRAPEVADDLLQRKYLELLS